jgi:hypothetical protein
MLGWIILGLVGALSLAGLIVMGVAMAHAEVGVDPFAGLPPFDDDEAARVLAAASA